MSEVLVRLEDELEDLTAKMGRLAYALENPQLPRIVGVVQAGMMQDQYSQMAKYASTLQQRVAHLKAAEASVEAQNVQG